MTTIRWVAVLVATLAPTMAVAQSGIVGCWQVESLVVDPAGTKQEPLGRPPSGQMIFTNDGQMSVILLNRDLPADYQVTDERMSTKLLVYYGTYTLKDKTLTIKTKGLALPSFPV